MGLFDLFPKYHKSAYGDIYAAVCSRLSRTGVRVGGTAGYPRVEVHTITESERQDKEGVLRTVSLTVESMSDVSLGNAVTMNQDNIRLLTASDLSLTGWTCVGVVPVQLQDLTETADSAKIIYRLLQTFDLHLALTKTDTDPTPPTNNETTN